MTTTSNPGCSSCTTSGSVPGEPVPPSAATPRTAAPVPCCSTAGAPKGARARGRRAAGAAAGTMDGWHPLQKAFHEEHALQCGYCTPGMIMAAADLLSENPDPTEEEIRDGLEGNLWRCTGQ